MKTPVSELKQQLQNFLDNRSDEQVRLAFRDYLALTLHDAVNPELESLALTIKAAFSDAVDLHMPEELNGMLSDLAKPEAQLLGQTNNPQGEYTEQSLYVPNFIFTCKSSFLSNQNMMVPAASGSCGANFVQEEVPAPSLMRVA